MATRDDTALLRVPEVAARLAIGTTTVRELIRQGELATVRIGRAVRVPASDLERFVTARSAGER